MKRVRCVCSDGAGSFLKKDCIYTVVSSTHQSYLLEGDPHTRWSQARFEDVEGPSPTTRTSYDWCEYTNGGDKPFAVRKTTVEDYAFFPTKSAALRFIREHGLEK